MNRFFGSPITLLADLPTGSGSQALRAPQRSVLVRRWQAGRARLTPGCSANSRATQQQTCLKDRLPYPRPGQEESRPLKSSELGHRPATSEEGFSYEVSSCSSPVGKRRLGTSRHRIGARLASTGLAAKHYRDSLCSRKCRCDQPSDQQNLCCKR